MNHEEIIQQMSVLIYNQPSVQRALTEVSKAGRTRRGLTEAGVAFVRAVTEVAMDFSQNPELMAQAIDASPTTPAAAVMKPGAYTAVALAAGDTVLHHGTERLIHSIVVGREMVSIEFESRGVLVVPCDTQIQVVKPYEPDAE